MSKRLLYTKRILLNRVELNSGPMTKNFIVLGFMSERTLSRNTRVYFPRLALHLSADLLASVANRTKSVELVLALPPLSDEVGRKIFPRVALRAPLHEHLLALLLLQAEEVSWSVVHFLATEVREGVAGAVREAPLPRTASERRGGLGLSPAAARSRCRPPPWRTA